MKKITFLILLLLSFVTFGQVNLDFEDGTTTVQFTFNGVGAANVANSQMNADNMSSRVLEITKPSGAAWFSGCGFQAAAGTPFVSMADGDQFTVKIYSTKANVPFRIRLQTDLDAVANTAYNYDFTVMTANQWIEYTIDFSGVVNGTEQYREIVIQPDYDPACEGGGCSDIAVGGTYLIDDFVQVVPMVDPSMDATLSDLTVGGTTVTGFSPNTTTYNVELPNGTSSAPTVAGTATQAGNGSSSVNVTQASSVPGTATLNVTAPNGTAMQMYTVNFTEAAALPPSAPTPPARESSSVVSIFSDAYTNVSNNGVATFAGATIQDVDLGGDTAIQFESNPGGGYQYNVGIANGIDLSTFTHLHFDYYLSGAITGGEQLQIILQTFNPTSGAFEANVIYNEIFTAPTTRTTGAWTEVDVTIASFNGANTDISNVGQIQVVFAGGPNPSTVSPMFIDNLYFHQNTILSNDDFDINTFTVYPNPTKNVWTIEASLSTIDAIEVYDILGKKVQSLSPNSQEATIDASQLRTGLYLAKVYSGEAFKTIRLIKE